MLAVVVDHSSGTQGVFGIGLLAGEFQDGKEGIQSGIIGSLYKGHVGHPIAGGLLIKFVIDNLIAHNLVGGSAANIGQGLQDMISAIWSYAVGTLQQLAQGLIVQIFGGLQEFGEDVNEFALDFGRASGTHLLQKFTGGLDLTMGGLHQGGVIESQGRTFLNVLAMLLQEFSRAIVLLSFELQAIGGGGNSSRTLLGEGNQLMAFKAVNFTVDMIVNGQIAMTFGIQKGEDTVVPTAEGIGNCLQK